MNDKLVDEFIETWGTMGSFWGINNSVARVHGLLIITDRPWCIDEIVERLTLSKSNVSTSLKELRAWNVVRKVFVPGDRREFYICEPNAWEMLFNIIRHRKQREFDPILAGVANTYEQAKRDPSGIAIDRLDQMKKMLDTLNKVAAKALSSEAQVKAMLSLLAKG
jgi:HTH-type transcriptional regulator, glycine betaine synthesis regulator